MPDSSVFNRGFDFFSHHGCLILSIATFLFALFSSWAISTLTTRWLPRLSKTPFFWGLSLLRSLKPPAIILIWSMSVLFVVSLILRQSGLSSVALLDQDKVQSILITVLLFWFFMRYIRFIELHLLDHPWVNRPVLNTQTNIRATAQVGRICLFIVFGLFLMKALGFPITTLLAFGSVGGLVISFAAKDSLANFFGGMMVYWDRPFSEGDWIRSPDRSIEGTVEHIGWRLTRIRSFDKRPVYVPNGLFSTIIIENPQRMTNRRIKTTIGLRYEDATMIEAILKDVDAMLRSHPEIDTQQTLMVNLIEFGPSSLNFLVYAFTKTTKWAHFQAVQQDVFLQIIGIITRHSAECAYPTTTVHLPQGIERTHLQGANND